jgi:hypothetical protein
MIPTSYLAVETRRSITNSPRAPVDLARDAVVSSHPHSCARHEVIEIRHSIRSRPAYSMCFSGYTLRQSSSSGGFER